MKILDNISNNKIYIAFISCSIILLCLIVSKIELYADDFFYVSFLEDGAENFIEKNIEHYNEVNGRVLVHILDQFVLNTNIYVYMAILIVCLLYDFYEGSKIILSCTKHLSNENLIYSTCVSTILFLLIDVYVLKETAFWTTGAFNYIIPVTISILAFSNIRKILKEDKINLFQIVLLFIAGATTEQGFMLTFFLTLLYVIVNNIDKKILFNKKQCLIFGIEILGFLTIFLSPASRARAAGGMTIFNTSVIELLKNNFMPFSMKIIGENSIFLIMSLILSAIAMIPLIDKRISKALISGSLLSVSIILINVLKIYNEIVVAVIMISIIMYVIFAIIEFFRNKDYTNIAILLSSAFLLQSATFALGELSYRSIFILAFLIIISTGSIVTIINFSVGNENNSFITVVILLVASCLYVYPILQGYNYNKNIFNKMKESINNYTQNGYVEIDLNIDEEYAHTMGYENGAFFDYFLQYYRIKDIEERVYFVSNEDAEIYIDKNKLTYPALIEENNIYVPTRFILDELGGRCEWSKETTKYFINDYFVIIDNFSNSIIDCSNKENININLKNSFKTYISRTYININALEYIVGKIDNAIIVGR